MLETVVANIREESINKGIELGKFEGEQNAILKILKKKFGKIPQSVEDKIMNIYSVEKLEEVLLAILDVTSISEVEKIINI